MSSPASNPHRAYAAIASVVFLILTAGTLHLAKTTGLPFLRPLAMLAGWIVVVTASGFLPKFRYGLRWIAGLAALAFAIWLPGRYYLPGHALFSAVPDDSLRLMMVAFGVAAFLIHFLATYGGRLREGDDDAFLDALVPLERLMAASLALCVGAIAGQLYLQKFWLRTLEVSLAFILIALLLETVLRMLARLYQPKRLRQPFQAGGSLFLPAIFGQAGPLRSLSITLEKTFGVKLGDAWLIVLERNLLAPFTFFLLLAIWLSTGLTRVPVDAEGVLAMNGAFQTVPLKPGLHAHSPWPWGKVTIVPTSKIQELSLGFEQDLSGPILWAEKHFIGEQNVLVGQGEELLTFNVPVLFRIKSPVDFLTRTSDPVASLAALGDRELLMLSGQHSSFQLMTTDRDEVADALHRKLQADCDALRLGIEIVFVGLKDVHPPVEVAPAFQDVVSAEEQKLSLIDQARTYSVLTGADASILAFQARSQSDSASTERSSKAKGESSRFLAPMATWKATPEVLSARLKLETLEEALRPVRQLFLVPAGAHQRTTFLLGDGASSPASAAESLPAPVIRPSAPVIRQVPRK
jgi:regulator of protease activity HflC (stomatin/prohibitin superfamily)